MFAAAFEKRPFSIASKSNCPQKEPLGGIFQYCSELVKYLSWSTVFGKFTCNAFLLWTTGAEDYISSHPFSEKLRVCNTYPMLLLCSEKLGKLLEKQPEQLEKSQVSVCRKLVQDV